MRLAAPQFGADPNARCEASETRNLQRTETMAEIDMECVTPKMIDKNLCKENLGNSAFYGSFERLQSKLDADNIKSHLQKYRLHMQKQATERAAAEGAAAAPSSAPPAAALPPVVPPVATPAAPPTAVPAASAAPTMTAEQGAAQAEQEGLELKRSESSTGFKGVSHHLSSRR